MLFSFFTRGGETVQLTWGGGYLSSMFAQLLVDRRRGEGTLKYTPHSTSQCGTKG